jgi:hypothetical protein
VLGDLAVLVTVAVTAALAVAPVVELTMVAVAGLADTPVLAALELVVMGRVLVQMVQAVAVAVRALGMAATQVAVELVFLDKEPMEPAA